MQNFFISAAVGGVEECLVVRLPRRCNVMRYVRGIRHQHLFCSVTAHSSFHTAVVDSDKCYVPANLSCYSV